MTADTLKELGNEIGNRSARRARLHRIAILVLKVVAAIAAGIATAAQFELGSGSWGLWNWVGTTATGFLVAATLYIVFVEEDASGDLEKARKAIDEAREATAAYSDVDMWKKAARRANALVTATSAIRLAAEACPAAPTDDDIIQTATAMMDAADHPLLIALGFEMEHTWTLNIYRAIPDEKGTMVMKVVAHTRSEKCDLNDAREWPERDGIPGTCYAVRNELVVADLQSPEGAVFTGHASLAHKTDPVVYRSAAAVPIKVDDSSAPWGLVVATTDVPRHFFDHDGNGVHPVEAVRTLAGNLSLLLRRRSGEVPSNRSRGGEKKSSNL